MWEDVSQAGFWGKTVAGRSMFLVWLEGSSCKGREVGDFQRWKEGPGGTIAETWAFILSEAGIHWRVLSVCFSPF